MSLDTAVNRYITALTELNAAKEELVSELKKVGISGRTIDLFLKNLAESVRKGNAKPPETPSFFSHIDEQAQKKEGVDTWELKHQLKDGEFVKAGEHFYYKVDGKLRKSRSLPLVKYNGVVLYFKPDDGKWQMKPVNSRGGLHPIGEQVAIEWIRDIIVHLNINDIEDVEVYEGFVKAMIPKMRPLARDEFSTLLDEYRAWKNRNGGNA